MNDTYIYLQYNQPSKSTKRENDERHLQDLNLRIRR